MNLKSDAKVQRFPPRNKKSRNFFIHLLRQQKEFATKKKNGPLLRRKTK